MCCLFGLFDYEAVWNRQQKTRIISKLAKECEARGTDATGIAFIQGNRVCVQKRPLPARKMRFSIPKSSSVIMGHTRFTTQGSEKDNYNNHPFTGNVKNATFALAHNGVLHNDIHLRKQESLPATPIQTDSYIAVQLIEKKETLDFGSLRYMAEKVEGSFCFTVMDKDSNLYFVKGDNPLCIYHYDGFYLYASTEEILKRALHKLRLPQKPCEKIELACGNILKIAATGKTELAGFDTTLLNRWNCSSWQISSLDRAEYMKELINYANFCGIQAEDVELLLDAGYDLDTVEELLYDPTLFQYCIDELLCDHYLDIAVGDKGG